MSRGGGEWDPGKELENRVKHGVDFDTASRAFEDGDRLVIMDLRHSNEEPRFFCIGRVGNRVLTVRFTFRQQAYRIIGAGFWRKGKVLYEKEKKEKRKGG